jgi:predicted dehydrogenase
MTPLPIAIIGTGHLGRIHTRLLLENPAFEVVAAVDPSAEARAGVARDFGVAVLSDYRELAGRIQAAVVATPTALHHEVASFLLAAGVHLLVEKPITMTTAQATALVELAEQHQRVLQVGHVERFNPAFRAALPYIEQPRYIEATRLAPYKFRSVDVGVVLDLMIHDLDLVLSTVASPVTSVSAMGATVIGPHEDLARARLEFANGCVADLSASRVSVQTRRQLQLYSATGHTTIDFDQGSAEHIGLSSTVRQQSIDPAQVIGEERERLIERFFEDLLPRQEIEVPEANALADEHHDLATAIRTGQPVQVPGSDGLNALTVAQQIVDSIAGHRWNGAHHDLRGPHFFAASSQLDSRSASQQRRAG